MPLKKSFILTHIAFMVTLCYQDCVYSETTPDKLVTDILTDYKREVRPICPDEPSVQVVFDLALRQIIELNEPKQILQTNLWLRVEWTDCRLTWNQTEVGVSNLVLPATSLWYPDITLYDSADEGMTILTKYRIQVTSHGEARHQIPVVLTSLCRIDTTYFPFDKQSCPLTFGSWAYNGHDVNITSLRVQGDLESFKGHVEWRVVDVIARRDVDYFDGVPYPTVVYLLDLRRKPLFFVLNLFFPCVLISLVAILGFLLPPDSGEKVNLEVTVLLSLAVFQLIILEMMPPNSETLPYISIYFATTMVLVGLSCFMTVVVLNIHFRGHRGYGVPKLARRIVIDGLGRLLCTSRDPPRGNMTHNSSQFGNGIYHESRKATSKSLKAVNSNDKLDTSVPTDTRILLKHFQRINDSLKDIVTHLNDVDAEKAVNDEWHLMALILDRLFLVLYGCFSLLVILVFVIEFSNQ